MNISKSLRLTLPIRSLALLSLALLPISSAWCRDASGVPPVPVLIPGAIILSDGTSISQIEIPSGRTRIICTGCGSVSKLRVGRDSYIYYSAAETSWCGLLDDVMWRLDPDSGLASTLPRDLLARDMKGGSFTFAERNIYGVTAGVCGPAGHPSLTPWVFRQLVPDGSPIPISILTDPSQGYVPLFIGDFLWAYNTRGLTVDRDGKLILATPDELIRIDPSSGSRELLYGSMATGGGIAGFTIETEPAGTLLYVRRWWTSDRPSGLYRVSPIPPAPFSVSPPPQLVAAQPFNLYNAPDLALDAHGRPLLLVQDFFEPRSEYELYRVNPVDGSVAVVLRFPTLRGGDFNRIAIVPPRPFDDCNPTSLSVQLCNTNLIASAQPTGTAVVDFSLDGWFSIAKGSYGLNLLEEAVTVRIDDVSVTLPEGSLKKNQNGEYVFDGKVGYVTRTAAIDIIPLRLRVTQIGGLQFTFAISGTAKLGKQAGETTVNLIVGNDRGSAKTIAQIFKK